MTQNLHAARIVDFPEPGNVREIRQAVLSWDEETGRILEIVPDSSPSPRTLVLPGFVDLHTHWPQWTVRGLARGRLLQWLQDVIFPEELTYTDLQKARRVARSFFFALARHGVTTAMVYSTIHRDATEVAFEEAEQSGLRIWMGKMMMDKDAPSGLQEEPVQSLEESLDLYRRWNGKAGRIFYVFSPRFALSVSQDLWREVGRTVQSLNAFLQTHLGESQGEMEALYQRTGYRSYVEYYRDVGILGPKTILGHCIHVSDEDLAILKQTQSRVVHNPSANLFLHSGRFPLERYDRVGVDFALGSDVGAGPSVSPFQVMRDMYYLNPVPIARLFYHATLAGAKALGMEASFGTLEPGKFADFVVLQLPPDVDPEMPIEHILSRLVFTGTEQWVREVYVQGHLVFQR